MKIEKSALDRPKVKFRLPFMIYEYFYFLYLRVLENKDKHLNLAPCLNE